MHMIKSVYTEAQSVPFFHGVYIELLEALNTCLSHRQSVPSPPSSQLVAEGRKEAEVRGCGTLPLPILHHKDCPITSLSLQNAMHLTQTKNETIIEISTRCRHLFL